MPAWPHSRRWGFYPSAAISLALLLVCVIATVAHAQH
jgi:hypothetical protein